MESRSYAYLKQMNGTLDYDHAVAEARRCDLVWCAEPWKDNDPTA
jgi:hypothetical protein